MYPYINFGAFSIHTYGLMIVLGVFVCSIFILKRAHKIGIANEEMIVVISVTLGVALLGATFLYITVSYSIKEIIKNILNVNFTFFKNGGFVFYGGLTGGIIGAISAVRWQKLDIIKVEQCIVPVVPLGHAIGRVGCLFAGCCHGVEYSGPFAVKSLLISIDKTYFPIQAVEVFVNLGIFIFLLWYVRKKHPVYNILCVYLLFYAVLRFILEFYRSDLIRGVFWIFSTSQWISMMIFLISIFKLYIFKEQIKDDTK